MVRAEPRSPEAALPAQNSPDWLPVAFGLLGGLALFLFGLRLMTDAVKAVAGGSMRAMLARLTRNRFTGALTGAFVTAVIQSSSVTTVLLVGFVTAGLMTLEQSVGVIMGANIGSTVTAQIIAFKVTDYALLMIALGYGATLFVKRRKFGLYGNALLGMGLLFLGMSLMSQATHPLRSYPPFLDLMLGMAHPLLGIAVGMLFTALVQSSAATTGIVIVLASGGMIRLEAGIALAFGANIGTCATAMLAALGKPREAVRAAVVHVVFNVAGVLVWLAFIDRLASLVQSFGGDVPRQIANAHTVFNIVNTVLFIGLTGPFARVARVLVPDRKSAADIEVRPKYLDSGLLDTPSLAIQASRMEIGHVGGIVEGMLARSLRVVLHGETSDLDVLEAQGKDVDRIYTATVEYLGRISRSPLTDLQLRRLTGGAAILNHVQNVARIQSRHETINSCCIQNCCRIWRCLYKYA